MQFAACYQVNVSSYSLYLTEVAYDYV